MKEIKFYPMSQKPEKDDCDGSFSKTVIVYSDKYTIVDLGYYDFEISEWFHFSNNSFLLKCWCYIPAPKFEEDESWEAIAPNGYKKFIF